MRAGMAFRLLLLLNLLVAGGLAWLWVDESGQWRPQVWVAPAPMPPELATAPAASAPGAAANPAQYMAILDRPLFAADRRPPAPPEPPPPEPPPDPLANLVLYGVYGGQGSGGILARVNGQVRRIRLNEAMGEWTVQDIKGREVTFARGEETRVVRLAHAMGPRPAAPPTAAAAPGVAPAPGVPLDRLAQQQQDMEAARERLRQRNELFRKAGLPPVKE